MAEQFDRRMEALRNRDHGKHLVRASREPMGRIHRFRGLRQEVPDSGLPRYSGDREDQRRFALLSRLSILQRLYLRALQKQLQREWNSERRLRTAQRLSSGAEADQS